MDMKAEVDELKYQYDKAVRVRDNLVKNLERRKKLNLLSSDEEYSLKEDIEEATRQADDLRRRMRSLESQHTRSKHISESNDKAPWEQ
jgi:hypothetical protein